MVAELEILSEWIPEQMQPGTIFVLENAGHIGEKEGDEPGFALRQVEPGFALRQVERRRADGGGGCGLKACDGAVGRGGLAGGSALCGRR